MARETARKREREREREREKERNNSEITKLFFVLMNHISDTQ